MEYSCFTGTKFLEPSEEKSEDKITWNYYAYVGKRNMSQYFIGIDLGWAVEDNRRKKVVIGQ